MHGHGSSATPAPRARRSGSGWRAAVLAVDRDGPVPAPGDAVRHDDWLRPRLWAGVPVLPVQRDDTGGWFAVGPRTIDAAPPAPSHVTPSG